MGPAGLLTLRRTAVLALLVVLFAACGGAGQEAAPTRSPRATVAGDPSLEPADDFTLATFGGDTFTLSDHFGELPVVLNFWAPW